MATHYRLSVEFQTLPVPDHLLAVVDEPNFLETANDRIYSGCSSAGLGLYAMFKCTELYIIGRSALL